MNDAVSAEPLFGTDRAKLSIFDLLASPGQEAVEFEPPMGVRLNVSHPPDFSNGPENE